MISLINHYFVPVYVSNEDYAKGGCAPAEEKAERDRIYREALRAKLSAGTVHVYLLAPDGHCIDSQHVATAAKVDELAAMLEKTVAKLQTPEGQPLAALAAQSALVPTRPDALVLHLTARYLTRQGNDYVVPHVALGETKAGGWGAYPGEDWIVLERPEWTRLLPAGGAEAGTSWEIDRDVADRLLNYFYPPTENNDVRKNRMEERSLKATVVSVRDGVALARVEGHLKMKHPFYHKDDDKVVETAVLGFLEFSLSGQRAPGLQLATDHAVYGRQPFGVAVRSLP